MTLAGLERVPARFRLANLDQLRIRVEPVLEFTKMGLAPAIMKALEEMRISTPTPIQSIAIPRLVKNSGSVTAVISAETGSGKTLSYLLPIIHKLKQEELGAHGIPRQLRAAILVPTNELVDQVHTVVKLLGHYVKLRVEKLGHGTHAWRACDLLVSTPKKLLSFGEYSSIKHLVIDEADTLLCDAQFAGYIGDIRSRLHTLQTQLYCSATITDALRSKLKADAKVVYLTSRGLHQPIRNIKHRVKVVKLPEEGRLAAVAKEVDRHEKTLIFCNSAASAIRLHKHMSLNTDLTPILFHGGIPERQRSALLSAFKELQGGVLIATDLMARGIDLPQVGHVILNGCPQSVADYLHRVGRVGRAGSMCGRVTSVIGGRQVPFARRLEALLDRRLLPK